MIWNLESPIYLRPGDVRVFTLTLDPAPGASAPTVSSPSAKIYVNNTDMTATYLSGSSSASGNTISLPTVTGLVKDTRYVLAVTADVDGVTKVKKGMIITRANGSEAGCDFEEWLVEYDSWNAAIAVNGVTNITSVSTAVYQNLSSVALTSGSDTSNANTALPKKVSGFTGGLNYVVEVSVVADGQTMVISFLLHIQKASDEQ